MLDKKLLMILRGNLGIILSQLWEKRSDVEPCNPSVMEKQYIEAQEIP